MTHVALSRVHSDQGNHHSHCSAKRFLFTPNEVTVAVNQPAVLVFKSEDVTHGMHREGNRRAGEIHSNQDKGFRRPVRGLLRC
jgi:hypothetical protein